MRDRWAEEITARAAAHWTPHRRRNELGDKDRLIPVVEAAPLLRGLRLLKGDGSMSRDAVRKTMQINHMVSLFEPVLQELIQNHSPVRILDVACGNSYLTLALAWCFEHRWHHPAHILGVDRNPGVVDKSRRRAAAAGLDGTVRFEEAPLEALDVPSAWRDAFDEEVATGDVHALVALHACDTATDEAIALGVRLEVDFIGAVPCCHAELARAWERLDREDAPGALAPVWASNHLRREAAATVTDALRMLLLRGCGYRTTAMEFVSSTHTPKNTLLRARRGGADPGRAHAEYLDLRAASGDAAIRLEGLVADPVD
jgi:SAM-dependent methyltransferase